MPQGRYIRTPEILERYRLAQLGKRKSGEWKDWMRESNRGVQNPFFGCHHSVEVKQFLQQRPNSSFPGESNPNWNGGISNEPYPIIFNEELKEQVRARDRYRCRLCGVPQSECLRKLIPHHIDYDKLNCILPNLISLCCRCNSKVNFNRMFWTSYFQVIINPHGERCAGDVQQLSSPSSTEYGRERELEGCVTVRVYDDLNGVNK